MCCKQGNIDTSKKKEVLTNNAPAGAAAWGAVAAGVAVVAFEGDVAASVCIRKNVITYMSVQTHILILYDIWYMASCAGCV
jgi:hypothetical protein